MCLLHFADLHLDTQFLWAEPAAAERRRQSLRDTLGSIADLAQRLEVDALLCAGDLLIAPGNPDWLGPRSLYALVPA